MVVVEEVGEEGDEVDVEVEEECRAGGGGVL